jgi:hypothetical protein
MRVSKIIFPLIGVTVAGAIGYGTTRNAPVAIASGGVGGIAGFVAERRFTNNAKQTTLDAPAQPAALPATPEEVQPKANIPADQAELSALKTNLKQLLETKTKLVINAGTIPLEQFINLLQSSGINYFDLSSGAQDNAIGRKISLEECIKEQNGEKVFLLYANDSHFVYSNWTKFIWQSRPDLNFIIHCPEEEMLDKQCPLNNAGESLNAGTKYLWDRETRSFRNFNIDYSLRTEKSSIRFI